MKKVFAFAIVSLILVSVLVFPAIAAVTVNSVTWDGGPEWLNSYQVRGYVAIFSYEGATPWAHIAGETNNGKRIDASVQGVGSARSNYVTVDLSGTLPLLPYCTTWVEQ